MIKILKEVKSRGINQIGVIKRFNGVVSERTVRKYLENMKMSFGL